MAIAQPTAVMAEYGQDLTWTVSLSPATDVTGWTVSCIVRAYNGGPALVTLTIGSGITVSDTGTGVFVCTFTDTQLELTHGPGNYVIQLHRTNDGSEYPITDPSPLILRPSDASDYPTLTNLGEYTAHAFGAASITLTDSMAQQLVQLMGAAEERVKQYCGRNFVYDSYTEYPDSTGLDYFTVRETPVTSITSLYWDLDAYYGQASNAFESGDLLTSGTDYYFEKDNIDGLGYTGKVFRVKGVWPMRYTRRHNSLALTREPHKGSIKITYVGGYTLIPYNLKQCVWNLTSIMEAGSIFGTMPQSESGEGYSRSLGQVSGEGDIPVRIRAVLDSYRAGRMFVG